MSPGTSQGEPADASSLTIDQEDLDKVDDLLRTQMTLALGCWTGYLETCNAVVRKWTESRRQALADSIKMLAASAEEPDADKKAELMTQASLEQAERFFKDLTSANIQGLRVGAAYSSKILEMGQSSGLRAWAPE